MGGSVLPARFLLFFGDYFQYEWRHHDGIEIVCGVSKIAW